MIRPPRPFGERSVLGSDVRVVRPLLGACALALVAACNSSPGLPEPEDLPGAADEQAARIAHHGPAVDLQESGTQRFVGKAYDRFDVARAMETVAFMDERVRTPGSPQYDEVLDRVAADLEAAGFGSHARFELEFHESTMDAPAWIPRRARVALALEEGGERVLHEFSRSADVDRVMLPRNAPSCDVRAKVAFSLDELHEGEVLVTRTSLRPDLVQRAQRKGAAAVVSAALAGYNEDFRGDGRHLDAIQYREVAPGTSMPVMQISPRSFERIEAETLARGEATLVLEADVELGERRVRTLVAAIVGGDRRDEAVVFFSHVQEPGASDNASGAAGQLESAIVAIDAIRTGAIEHPARTLVFVWGMEFEESEVWLERTEREPFAAVNAVMVGNSRENTGAVPLLERYPDPGAVATLAPDKHTLWGAGDVELDWLVPNGVSVVARCALVDVSRHVGGDWETYENPWEGGTDHDNLIKAGVPVVLFWHFPDFTFHTSLDRYEMVDGEELRRMSVAALATGLALSDPRPMDLDRYLRSMAEERRVRVEAAEEAERPIVAEAWREWCLGVQHWFRALCLSIELEPSAALPISAGEELQDSQFAAEDEAAEEAMEEDGEADEGDDAEDAVDASSGE